MTLALDTTPDVNIWFVIARKGQGLRLCAVTTRERQDMLTRTLEAHGWSVSPFCALTLADLVDMTESFFDTLDSSE